MNKIIIIPDIHNWVWDIEEFLKTQEPYGKVIFLGDYFDNFKESLDNIKDAAEWLKTSLQKENRVHLLGNHDAAYRFFKNSKMSCSGFTHPKAWLIDSILTQDDWEKIKLVHFEENFIFSHAGCHKYIFEHPIKGMTKEYIIQRCDEAIQIAKAGLINDVWGLERAGGLWVAKPGITWTRELPTYKEWSQIFGHTPQEKPKIILYSHKKNASTTFNVCLDSFRAFGILDLKEKYFGWGRRMDGKIIERFSW